MRIIEMVPSGTKLNMTQGNLNFTSSEQAKSTWNLDMSDIEYIKIDTKAKFDFKSYNGLYQLDSDILKIQSPFDIEFTEMMEMVGILEFQEQ